MAYDYSKLIGRIAERFGTRAKFAEAMSLSEHSMSVKLNGKKDFRQGEIGKACALLDIEDNEIADYFFTPKVQLS